MKSHTKKKRKWIVWTAIILVVVLVGVIFMINRAKHTLQAMMPTYQQVQATTGDLDLTVYGSGSLAASDAENVPAPISGAVAEWYFEEGDEVHTGDLLGVMDTDQYDEQVDALKEKIEELSDAIDSGQSELDSSIVYAPIDGIVKELYVQPGSDISKVNQVYGCFMRVAPDDTMTLSFTPSDGYAGDVGDYVLLCPEGYSNINGEVTAVSGPTSIVETSAYIPSDTSVTVKDISGEEEIGSGKLTAKDAVTITGNNEISEVYVSQGQHVVKGQKLLKYDLSATSSLSDKQKDLNDAREDLAELEASSPEIIATADGVLTALNNTELNKDLTAAQISPLDAMDLVVAVDELDIAKIQEGQPASISIDALPDKSYTGTVSRISQVGVSGGGVTTYDVTLTINETEGLRLGMNASAEILVDSRQGVILLPVEAIQYQGDKPYVLLASGGDASPSPDESAAPQDQQPAGDLYAQIGAEGTMQFVEVGLMNEQFAEILSGVKDGDVILAPPSSSSGSLGMGGMMGGGPVIVTSESRSSSDSRNGRWQGR